MNLSAILAWLEAHPMLVAQVVVPAATAAFTWLLKPRSESEYAAMGPRMAGLHKIVAGLGIDAPKLADGVMLLLLKKRSARSIPPPSPSQRDTPTDPEVPVHIDDK
jgi:hypothetical protein